MIYIFFYSLLSSRVRIPLKFRDKIKCYKTKWYYHIPIWLYLLSIEAGVGSIFLGRCISIRYSALEIEVRRDRNMISIILLNIISLLFSSCIDLNLPPNYCYSYHRLYPPIGSRFNFQSLLLIFWALKAFLSFIPLILNVILFNFLI